MVDLHFILPDHIFVVDEQFLRAFVTVDNNLPVQLQSWQHGTGPIPGVRHSRGRALGLGLGLGLRLGLGLGLGGPREWRTGIGSTSRQRL